MILASAFAANLEVARQLGAELDGKIVVDISNPLNEKGDALIVTRGASAAETIAAVLPDGAKLIKAFNTTFAGTLLAGEAGGQPLDVFIAGDDGEARESVASLVRSEGSILSTSVSCRAPGSSRHSVSSASLCSRVSARGS